MNDSDFDTLLKEAVETASERDAHILRSAVETARKKPRRRSFVWLALISSTCAVAVSVGISFWLTQRMVQPDESNWIAASPAGDSLTYYTNFYPTSRRRGCLSIGVGQYLHKGLPDLPNARGDAAAMIDLASKDWENWSMLMRDDQATEVVVRAAFLSLQEFSKPDDLVLVFLAGHGGTGQDETWRFLAHDSSPEGGLSLQEAIRLAGDAKVVLIVDSCESGALTKANLPFPVLAATGSREAFNIEGRPNSTFCKAFFEALNGRADLPISENGDAGDGVVTLDECSEYVKSEVAKATGDLQQPILYMPMGMKADEIALSRNRRIPVGSTDVAAAGAKLDLRLSGGDWEIAIDGNQLGTIRSQRVLLPVIPGDRSVTMRHIGNSSDHQTKQISVHPGKVIPVTFGAVEIGVDRVSLFSGTEALFPNVEAVPSGAVTIDDLGHEAKRVQFRWGTGAAKTMRFSLMTTDLNPVSLQEMMDVSEDEAVELELWIQAEQSPAKVRLSVGSSLPGDAPAVGRVISPERDSATPVRFELTGSSANALITGLTFEVSQTDYDGLPSCTFIIRDAIFRVGRKRESR